MSKDARDKIAELIDEKYGRLIMKIAYDITKDYENAEDIKQEVVFKCCRQSDTLESLTEGRLHNYVCTAAKHTAINALKKTQLNERRHAQYIEENMRELMIDYVDFKAFQNQFDLSDETVDMLKSLKQVDRSIILMKYCIGMSNAEVAEALNLTEANLKKRFQRVKIKLMNSFIDSEGDEIDE